MIPYSPHVLLALGLLNPQYGLLAEPTPPLSTHKCGISLAEHAGLSPHDAEIVVGQIELHSVSQDEEFLRVLYALAYVESRFRTDRRSSAGAVGILQVTLDAAKHIHVLRRTVGLREVAPTLKRLSQVPINVNYGSAYLWLALEEADGDYLGALTMYNGGYRQLTNLRRGAIVTHETAQYVLRVMTLAFTCGVKSPG